MAGSRKSSQWIVVRTKFDEETTALRNIKSQSFEAYLPRYRARVNKHGERKVLPLFPGYLFVKLPRGADWTPLRNTRGVHSLMYSGAAPARVPNADIKRFKSMEDDRGYVVIPEEEPPQFKIGDIVVAFTGMCAGHIGTYAGKGSAPSRGNVIFAMMSKAVKLEVSLYDLA